MSPSGQPRPRLALIGVSGYAGVHLRHLWGLHQGGGAVLTAATVINPEAEAEAVHSLRAGGVRLYRDYEEMMRAEAGKVDLCVIPTGIPWHARMTIAALQAGMNVLVEKPLAGCLADVQAIREAERAAGRFVAVGFQDLYTAEARWLKRALCAGRIGRLHRVRLTGLWPRGFDYYTRNPWAGRIEADGAVVRDSPINNAFAHFVHLALFLAGPDERRSARVTVRDAELYRAHAIETFDTAVVRAASDTGVDFWFGLTHACGEQLDPELVLEGTAGRAEWLHLRHAAIHPEAGEAVHHSLPPPAENRGAMQRAAVARVRDADVFIADTAMSEAHAALVEQVHELPAIQTLPASVLETRRVPDRGLVPSIRGIEQLLRQAGTTASRLRDVGFSPENFSPS